MLIIYGTRKLKFKKGLVRNLICPQCHNVGDWQITKVVSCFTLFYIPIIPYYFQNYLICPVCQAARKLTKEEYKACLLGTWNPGNSFDDSQDGQNRIEDTRPLVFQIQEVIEQQNGDILLGGAIRQGTIRVGEEVSYVNKEQVPFFRGTVTSIGNNAGPQSSVSGDESGNVVCGIKLNGIHVKSEFETGNYLIK